VQSNGCLDVTQQGGSCEDTRGTLTHFSGTLGDGQTCSTVLASSTETETQVCMQTLGQIFSSQCASTLQETPCLCGSTDAAQCLAGTATPTGPVYDLYQCDFDTTDINTIQAAQFTNQQTGAGQANALVQCAAAFGCNCFCTGGNCTACMPLAPTQACGAHNCGIVSDGCGGSINCGTCAAPSTCSGANGGPGTCSACTPVTNSCGTALCGFAKDNCGNSVSCGACPTGFFCNTSGQCTQGAGACDITSNTALCLGVQGPTCLSCMQSNGCLDVSQLGGSCEDTPGTLPHFPGTLGDGKSCSAVFSSSTQTETETQVCLQALGEIFSSKCAASLQEGPCLCGSANLSQCLAGFVIPTGPLYDLYQCDFDTTNISVIQSSQFTNQAAGAGQANALVQCAAAFGCGCF
jgi:hypothetical protein